MSTKAGELQLTDGLRAEREQEITIDIAYRYFATPRRSFIIAGTPGHVLYTRNMVTGASTADLAIILIDARHGVIEQSRRHAFLATLLYHLEHVHVASDRNLIDARLPVQWVIRPGSDAHHDYRAYAGRLAGGVWRAGDEVLVLPSGARSRIASVDTHDGTIGEAFPPMSVAVRLEDELDVSRGDMLCPHNHPDVGREIDAMVCWMSPTPAREGGALRAQAHHALDAMRGLRGAPPSRRRHSTTTGRPPASSSTRSGASCCAPTSR